MAAKKPKPAGPAWTKAQRAALNGARRPHPLDPPAVPTERDAAWQVFLSAARAIDASNGPVLVERPEHAAVFAPVQRALDTGDAPDKLDVVTEMLRAHLVVGRDRDAPPSAGLQALIAFWVATAGFEWLFELARSPTLASLAFSGAGDAYKRHFFGVPPAPYPNRTVGMFEYTQARSALRRYFFSLSNEAFAEQSERFVRAANASFERLDPKLRHEGSEQVWRAFVLGRDGSHAHALFAPRANGRDGTPDDVGLMLASITDLALATKVVTTHTGVGIITGAAVALDLVETFEKDAVPLLETVVAGLETAKPKLPAYTGRFKKALALAKTAP